MDQAVLIESNDDDEVTKQVSTDNHKYTDSAQPVPRVIQERQCLHQFLTLEVSLNSL